MKPLVAIVGRPNVGKSTLFNRLIGRRIALVEDQPGVTRDRHYADAQWGGRAFTFIDTGGFVPGEKDSLLKQVREQAQLAVEECDVIIFVTDGREGVTGADEAVAKYLRKSGKPVIVAVNKLDTTSGQMQSLTADFYKMGLGEVHAMSAEHGLGVPGLFDEVVEKLPPKEEGEDAEAPPDDGIIRVAIIGRPNVGKSTLVNAILKEKRVVASEIPGTTRDPIDSPLTYKDRKLLLTDTAGIRRKKTIAHQIEKYSVIAALKVMERSDVAVLLMDATEPAVDQDAKLAGLAEERGRALVIVVNKWDLIDADQRRQEAFRESLRHSLKFVGYAPIIFTSALTGSKVEKVMDAAVELAEQFRFRAPTPQLNRLLEYMVDNHPAPIVRSKPLRLYYITQVTSAPPTFALTCNHPEGVPDMYKRYITNQLRKTFDLRVPIRLVFRERPGQAKRAARKRPSHQGKH
ncbi:ribosome biogenesis GTPase Der [Myxococcus sp. CA051A]|uniref:ribosome biogenesis GTPase Der n=1 Tax=unclassified Myxococcus TaxID=2648731 RepID=UPI00157A9BF9|nr:MULTISPECIES: ribosome biogenesis GTPase Der [unclassified Myxococcus]NTX36754.1 ribosome biogenesis GTPase Der [Myxococcus sp. CA033]NTX49755.1 ribosome biogenesis GTPase Der [Myxococcus sp. CA039A]NTX62606.1 ribosome biogenesis GTPase Der [Myxococcus sp. CA051A]